MTRQHQPGGGPYIQHVGRMTPVEQLRMDTNSLDLLDFGKDIVTPNMWSVSYNFRFAWEHVVDRTQSQVGHVFVSEVRQPLIMFISGWLDAHGSRLMALIDTAENNRIETAGILVSGYESDLHKAENWLQQEAMKNWLERNRVYND